MHKHDITRFTGLGTFPTLWVKEDYLFHRRRDVSCLMEEGRVESLASGAMCESRAHGSSGSTEERLPFICDMLCVCLFFELVVLQGAPLTNPKFLQLESLF